MNFLLFGSSLAHLEPGLELFVVDDIGDDGDDDLSHHYLPNFEVKLCKSLLVTNMFFCLMFWCGLVWSIYSNIDVLCTCTMYKYM